MYSPGLCSGIGFRDFRISSEKVLYVCCLFFLGITLSLMNSLVSDGSVLFHDEWIVPNVFEYVQICTSNDFEYIEGKIRHRCSYSKEKARELHKQVWLIHIWLNSHVQIPNEVKVPGLPAQATSWLFLCMWKPGAYLGYMLGSTFILYRPRLLFRPRQSRCWWTVSAWYNVICINFILPFSLSWHFQWIPYACASAVFVTVYVCKAYTCMIDLSLSRREGGLLNFYIFL